jgi:hypothetical protein
MIESVIESTTRSLQPCDIIPNVGNFEKQLRYYLGAYSMDEDCYNEVLQYLRDQVIMALCAFLFILFLELQFITRIPFEVGFVFLVGLHIFNVMVGCNAYKYKYK